MYSAANSATQVNSILFIAVIVLSVFLFFLGIAVCFAIIQINSTLKDIRDIYFQNSKANKSNQRSQVNVQDVSNES